MASVLAMARALGWRAYHTRDSRGSEPGFPDVVLARRGRVIFAELKTESGRVTRPQLEWLGDLPGAVIWRPGDLLGGDVERSLRDA